MTLQAVDGRVLALALTIAAVAALTAWAGRRVDRMVNQALPDKPQPEPEPQQPPEQPPTPTPRPEFACLKYVCRDCRRPTHEHATDWDRILHLVTEWTCPDCVLIAAYEKEFAQS